MSQVWHEHRHKRVTMFTFKQILRSRASCLHSALCHTCCMFAHWVLYWVLPCFDPVCCAVIGHRRSAMPDSTCSQASWHRILNLRLGHVPKNLKWSLGSVQTKKLVTAYQRHYNWTLCTSLDVLLIFHAFTFCKVTLGDVKGASK